MSEQQLVGQEAFQALLWNYYGQIGTDDALHKVRAKAWDHFLELGLPTRQTEVFKYVRLRSLYAQNYVPPVFKEIAAKDIEAHILPECSQSVLVFVNGHFSPSLSRTEAIPRRASATTLAEAMRTYSSFLTGQWTKALKEETDPFAAANLALQREGLFIYVPPRTVIEAPVQLLNVIDTESSPMLLMPRMQAFIGAQSQMTVVSTQAVLSGAGYAVNMVADVSIEDDAHFKYIQIASEEGPDIWHFDAFRATLKRDSTLKTIAVTDGAATVRYDNRVILTGENAEASVNGVWMLKEKREAHVHVLVDHQAPHCRSMQLYKGALNDFSHSSFEGKILVRQAAQKTDAFQLNNNLLLSDRAHADSKPNLEIFADDVKASHGSTVGQLDQEQIFYMKTRGFSEAAAKNILVYGYCKEVIDLIPIASVHETMRARAEHFLM